MTARARRAGHQLPAAEQRHRDRRAVRQDGAGAGRARRRGPAERQRAAAASSCSTSRSSAPATSSSRSPTSARSRASSTQTIEQHPGRLRRAGAAGAADRPALRRQAAAGHRGRAAVGDSTSLDPARCAGIAQLVASSVQGLQLENVTITDSPAQLLWPTRRRRRRRRHDASKQAAEAALRPELTAAQLNAMLAQTLGPGKAQVQVNADLNVDQTTRTRSTTPRRACRCSRPDPERDAQGQRRRRRRRGRHGRQHPAATRRAARRQRQLELQEHDRQRSTFGVDKTVTHTTSRRARSTSQTSSLLVDKSVPAADVPAITDSGRQRRRHQRQARRHDLDRPDRRSPSRRPRRRPRPPTSLLGYAKYVARSASAPCSSCSS